MAVVPAFVHRRLAEEIAPHVEENALLVLNPGRTGGALEVASILAQKGKHIPVAEAQTLLFACRRKGEKAVHLSGIKNLLKIGVFPSKRTNDVMIRLKKIFPQFQAVPDVLTTSLGNIGAMFHPASALLNVGPIQSGRDYDYYRETMTPAVTRVIEKVDQERMAIARACRGRGLFCSGLAPGVLSIERGISLRDASKQSSLPGDFRDRRISMPGISRKTSRRDWSPWRRLHNSMESPLRRSQPSFQSPIR